MGPRQLSGPHFASRAVEDQMIWSEVAPLSAKRGWLLDANVVLVVCAVMSLDCEGCSGTLPIRA